MCYIDRKEHRIVKHTFGLFLIQSKTFCNPSCHIMKQDGSRALLTRIADFLMIKKRDQVNAFFTVSLHDCLEKSRNRCLIVKSRCRKHRLLNSDIHWLLNAISSKFKVQDIFLSYLKLTCQKFYEIFTALLLLGQHIHDWHQIGLVMDLHPLIHIAIHMDGKIRDCKNRLIRTIQNGSRCKHILTSDNHTSRHTERTVKPCIKNWSAIYFHINLCITVRYKIRMWLNSHTRIIGMCCCHAKHIFCTKLFSHGKCIECCSMVIHHILSARHK